jgi:hypothetical protein
MVAPGMSRHSKAPPTFTTGGEPTSKKIPFA